MKQNSSGRRAAAARDKLEEMGFPFLILYEGSFLDWKANGGETIWNIEESI